MDKILKEMPKEAVLDKIEQRTSELMENYHGCGQCGLLAIQETFGFEDPILFKAASGLSGGIGGLHSVCGALTGAALALGLKFGREVKDLDVSKEYAIEREHASFVPVAKLAKWFEREFGSTICCELRKRFIGVDLDTSVPWQKQMAEELGLGRCCNELAKKTARKVAEMLLQDNP